MCNRRTASSIFRHCNFKQQKFNTEPVLIRLELLKLILKFDPTYLPTYLLCKLHKTFYSDNLVPSFHSSYHRPSRGVYVILFEKQVINSGLLDILGKQAIVKLKLCELNGFIFFIFKISDWLTNCIHELKKLCGVELRTAPLHFLRGHCFKGPRIKVMVYIKV